MKIDPGSLLSLEAYAKARKDLKPQIIAHRRLRSVALGEHMTLQFEDERTIRYQIQEMLRAEKIFEEEGIRQEIEAYEPLIPDGTNWKATVMIEYPDEHERRRELARLIGVEGVPGSQSLDGDHAAAIGLHSEHGAGLDGLAVKHHGAGPADGGFAADVRAGQPYHLAEVMNQ